MKSLSLPVDEALASHLPEPGDLRAAYQHLLSCREPSYLSELTMELLHKFNNRMTGVIFHVDEAAQSVKDDERLQQRMEKVRGTLLESLQLISTIGRLHFQQHAGERTYYSLERVIKAAMPLLVMLLPKGTSIQFEPPKEQICFYGSMAAVEEILLHLFSNAGQAVADEGVVTLQVGADAAELDGAQSWIIVRDNGSGIAEELLPRLFTPLATTRGSQGHAGLGLYRARKLARELGGDLTGGNCLSGGAEFCLLLPQSNAEPDA